MRIVIIGNYAKSILEYLINAIETEQLPVEIVGVISTINESELLQTAALHCIPTKVVAIPPPSQAKDFYDESLARIAAQFKPDLILLLAYARILSNYFLELWPDKILNVHGSLLPKHAGLIGEQVQKAILTNDEKMTGCTVHLVSEQVDMGRIITQKIINVNPDDTPTTLRQRTIEIAGPAYVDALKIMLKN